MNMNPTMKEHWEKVYRDKRHSEVSWWQDNPKTSLDFIHSFNITKAAQIIDIGGGDSRLVDCLLDEGFGDITVLDISEAAIERAKFRLGDRAQQIHWVVSDVNDFQSEKMFDVWHDRATFHFLTAQTPIEQYTSIAQQSVKLGGYLILGTFSSSGPRTCSGLPVHQYDARSLTSELRNGFDKIKCITEDHITPFKTKQNFLFCSFQRHRQPH
jgi:2-polyprenyl-3-methyl-5-hydroxy-6-metoxy-1,4-benzoquinol methylase